MKMIITDFAKRQFKKDASGTRINISVEEFEDKINTFSDLIIHLLNEIEDTNISIQNRNQKLLDEKINNMLAEDANVQLYIDKITISKTDPGYEEKLTFLNRPDVRVMEGYKPFCKLVAIENFTKARVGTMQITNENYQYLRSGYSGRRDSELPVLSRWFELPLSPPRAKYLILVLYSREQLEKEYNENGDLNKEPFEMDGEWGVVSVLGQRYNKEEPMTPVTAMRNALGTEEGGSGAELDKEYYERSVSFWSNNAIVKQR